jgi:hypothetical protein
LIPCIRARRMLKSSRMGLGKNDIHEHLLVNSFAHARQCMWFVQIESQICFGFILSPPITQTWEETSP